MKSRKTHEIDNKSILIKYLGRKKVNAGVFFAVLITLVILMLIAFYVYFNDFRPKVVLNVFNLLYF